jgi:Peptidase_C39 like family
MGLLIRVLFYFMTKLKIPFHPNRKDNLHCFQASVKMALAVLDPSTRYSYATIDRITGYQRRTVTWDIQTLLWLAQKDFHVKKISIFDYRAFAKRGTAYLKDFWRPDVYELQKSLSDLHTERQLAKKLLETENIKLIRKHPTLAVLEKHLASGWLAIIHIDVSRFDKTKSYSPHSIIVVAVTPTTVFFHDPGLPPEINRRVSRKKFADVISDGELLLIK